MPRPDSITLKQLRALSAVQERGSVTLAADKLNLTVPAVSTQLKLLAQNMGAKLIERTSDGRTILTLQGEQVLTTINKMDSTLEQCFRAVAAINSGKSGLVTLGVVSTGKHYAPTILALAKKELSDVQIDLVVGNRQHMIAGLGDQSIDIAIMGRPPRQPPVESISLGDHPHVIIAPPGHRLTKKKTISATDLLSETIILREPGSGTRILTERFLDRFGGGTFYESIEFNSNETIKQAVIAGLGIAMLSAHAVGDALDDGRVVAMDLPGLPIIRQWFLVRVVGVARTAVANRVHDFIAENSHSFLPPYTASH